MATKRNSRFTPVFESQNVRATVVGMNGNVINVKFQRSKQSRNYRVSNAAKQGRVV